MFELQVKFNTGWQPVDSFDDRDQAAAAFIRARRRWKSLKVRLRHNGKTLPITLSDAWRYYARAGIVSHEIAL